jgi:hypothetical protein
MSVDWGRPEVIDDFISAGERHVGASIPSDLAALGLMTNSNLVG